MDNFVTDMSGGTNYQKLCVPDTELVSTKSDICWALTLILPHVVDPILWQCFPDVLQRFFQ